MRRACARSKSWRTCTGKWPRRHRFKSVAGLFQRGHQPGIGETGGRATVLRLPVADRAPRLESGQAVGAADIVALGLQCPLQAGDVGSVELVHRAPAPGEALVAIGDAIARMADEQGIE